MRNHKDRAAARRASLRMLALVPLLLAAGACDSVLDDLLEADLPGQVLDETLRDPRNADLLVVSVASDLNCALGGYIVAAGAVGDEITWSDNNTFDYDRRTFTPSGGAYATTGCDGIGVYQPLSTARWSADNAHDVLDAFSESDVPGVGAKKATVSAYGAYATLLLGEGMCQAAIDVGPALSRRQVWEAAEERFTRALQEAEAAGAADVVSLALVGRARTRLNLATNPESPLPALAAAALEDARRVPAGFAYMAEFAGADVRSFNKVYFMNNDQIRTSIEDDFWHLEWQGVADPRVSLEYTGKNAFDGNTPLVEQQKYGTLAASIPLARWAEAQLIIAEIEGGQTAVDIINALHAAAGLPPFASTDAAEIRAHVIQERERELFLEGHHLNDKIRFDLPFTPAPGTPYKLTGGGTYGDMECFPLPDVERFNNPNVD